MNPEQQIEARIDHLVSGLWERWYESGELEPIPGAPLPERYRGWEQWRNAAGERIVRPLSRAEVRRLEACIVTEFRER